MAHNPKHTEELHAEHDNLVAGEHQVRLAKVKELQDACINPWPEFKPVSATCAEAQEAFAAHADESAEYRIAGRMLSKREHGKTIFINIQDRSGQLQVYIRQDVIGDDAFAFVKHMLDVGDIVWVRGTLFVTKMGEATLRGDEIVLLSKCLHPLPEKYHGLVDVEQRYRQRHLDLISNPASRDRFMQRFKIVQAVRNFLLKHDFLEVETPMLHPIPGGAAARPFITHHNAYDIDLYLRISPELYLKRLVVGGLERVFEINRDFRNEGVSTKHNPEFTILEFYLAHGDCHTGMDLTEQLIASTVSSISHSSTLKFGDLEINFTVPFPRMTVLESLQKVGRFSEDALSKDAIDATIRECGVTFDHKNPSYGEKLWALFEARVGHQLMQPTFITGHPLEVSPLAKRDTENPYAVARFELFVGGMELANGFSELNDPFDQAERFKKQAEAGAAGHEEAHRYDADFIRAIEFGLPPTVGVGIGIDRLAMMLTNTTSIKDMILFPTMKPVL